MSGSIFHPFVLDNAAGQDTVVGIGSDSEKYGVGISSHVHVTGIGTFSDLLHTTGIIHAVGGIKDTSGNIGSSGKVLSSTGSGLQWIDPSEGSTANAVNVGTNLNSTNSDQFVAFMGANSGNNPVRVDAGIKYNPSSNLLTVGSITGSIAASNINSGTLGLDRIPSLPASKITSGQFDAARIPTLNQNTTGNAATATTLQNSRNIGGVSFNGSENINLPGVNIAGNQNTSGIADKAETARIVTDSSSAIRPILFIASSGSDNSAVNNTFASLKFSPTIYSLSYNPNTEVFYVNQAQLNKIRVSSGGVGNAGQVLTSGGSGSNMTWTYPVPSGGIIIWSGAANAIPSGWVLCDGNNSTPDLRGRFVVGYSNTDNDYDVGDTGGNKKQTLSINQIPSHTHSYSSANHPTSSGPEQNQSGGPEDRTTFNVSKTTGSTGGGQPVDVRPPYYALCYIMKT